MGGRPFLLSSALGRESGVTELAQWRRIHALPERLRYPLSCRCVRGFFSTEMAGPCARLFSFSALVASLRTSE